MSARVKALLANYFRQQNQIFMPDLVLSQKGDLELITKSNIKVPHPVVNSKVKRVPDVQPSQINKQPATPTLLNISPSSKNKLSTLRKVDQLSISPQIKKPIPVQNVVLDTTPVSFDQKRDALKKLYFEGCTLCHLATTRKKMVFGSGNVDAPVMIIGEAPGEEEDIQGLPFVGAAGQLLTQMLGAIKLDRAKDIFITNILKCRPPSNRSPESMEIQTCLPLLNKQISILQPKAILLLGRIAAHSLLGVSDSIAKMRSKVFDYSGIPCMVLYHPAALLRNAEYKRPAWEDLQKFKEMLDKMGVYGSSL